MTNTEQWLQEAIPYHTTGNLSAAEPIYRRILEKDPDHSSTNYLLGSLFAQQKRHAEAIEHLQRALVFDPKNVSALNNLGVAFKALRRFEEATEIYAKTLKLKPDYTEAHCNLGSCLNEQERYEEAAECFRKSLSINPDYVEAHNNLGISLKELGQSYEALSHFREAIRLRPHYSEAYNNLGAALHAQKRYSEAIEPLREAIALDPDFAEAFNNLGDTLRNLDDFNEAIIHIRRALEIKPDFAEAYINYGICLCELGFLEQGIQSYHQALNLKPQHAEAHYNLGSAYKQAAEFDKALFHFHSALAFKTKFIEAYNALGALNHELGRFPEAIACYDHTLRLEPEHPSARWNRALLLLMDGDFENGWREYEWRFQLESVMPRAQEIPRWNGEDLQGKTLLVLGEQGLGDTFHFARYLPLAKASGATVIFECQRGLKEALAQTPGFDIILERPADKQLLLPQSADVRIPLLSLPYVLGTTMETIPGNVPYIYANPKRESQWRDRIDLAMTGHEHDIKIGIVWSGNPKSKNDRGRSCKLADFAAVANIPGVTFFSLQKGPAAEQALQPPDGMRLIDLGPDLEDFADTAAAIDNFDLVISVCTSVTHLAGAMGKPTWTLLGYSACWRWLEDREDSPWYPTMRLFRQAQMANWASVFEEVAVNLCNESGVRAWERGDHECAISALLMAMELNPRNRDTVLNCADVLKAFGDEEQARTMLYNYLRNFPGDNEATQMYENLTAGSVCLAA
jgi:tetratricopeptide (TPR) repeat protein